MEKNALISSYEKQLPKYKPFEFWSIFGRFAAVVSVVAFCIGIYYKPNTIPEYIYSIFLCILVLFLVVYTYIRESRKKHRYSEAFLFIAHSSHLIKDYLKEFTTGEASEADLKHLHERLAEIISSCFSLLKGKQCSVCIKTLDGNGELRTVARDPTSSIRYHEIKKNNNTKHLLEENTDFKLLFEDDSTYSRYFIEKNLKTRWKAQDYENSSFAIVGAPKIKRVLNTFHYVVNWNLPYLSTLVCPIRHITTRNCSENSEYKHYWGFLCIDTNSRGLFNKNLDPEVAYCFANQIYILASEVNEIIKLNDQIDQMHDLLDEATDPTKS